MIELIGRIVFKLQPYELHLKFREQFMEYFKFMLNHRDLKYRRMAAFNLPCFNSLFHHYQDEFDIDFNEVYLRLTKDEDP